MSEFQELFGVDDGRAINFFYQAIKENMPNEKEVEKREAEIIHCASVLAGYSLTSSCSTSTVSFPITMSLEQFFDVVVMDRSFVPRPEEQVQLGAQVLFLAGFFRNQFSRRHNLAWYDRIGVSYYESASRGFERRSDERSRKQAIFCSKMSVYYPFWVQTLGRVHRSFQRNQLDHRLIKLS